MLHKAKMEQLLLDKLTDDQKKAVRSDKRRVLVVAGAGSGKTEVMARRIAWWVGVENVPRDRIVAFTFTERAAEEMKFRIRSWIARITPDGEDVSLGNMYIGTIHAFCLAKLREFWPDDYHNYDVLDEASRAALILRGFNFLLGLQGLRKAWGDQGQRKAGQYETVDVFIKAYDQLHEHNRFEVKLPDEPAPYRPSREEDEWCKRAKLLTNVGKTPVAVAFAESAARYYAYLRCRRFLDFATSQTEFIHRLSEDVQVKKQLAEKGVHLVVDEVQDINPVQRRLIELLVGTTGHLTTVGDHRQAIYGFRGARVQIIGELWEEFKVARDAEVVDLRENFRSTPRIIELANAWAETILPLRTMKTPPMSHGSKKRKDHHRTHVAVIGFDERAQEAGWIAEAIRALVPSDTTGAEHDKKDGATRGIAFSDVAVLVRTSSDVRTYMRALEAAGVPCVVKAGPDLFSQPEVLFVLSAVAISAGQKEFLGYSFRSLPKRIETVLHCGPETETVLKESAKVLRQTGLAFDRNAEERALFAARAIHERIAEGKSLSLAAATRIRTPKLRAFLTSRNELRRVFPQQLYHFLLAEAGVEAWDTGAGRGQAAMFHLGALSGLITGIETPGWVSPKDYPYQITGLCLYGTEQGRAEEQPLMVQPEAVTISTIHGVKGLEFAAVFLADVTARRFPNQLAGRAPELPLDGPIVKQIDVAGLGDNENRDNERRLMYVALTRAERFLFVSCSGKQTSQFIKELRPLVDNSGGVVTDDSDKILQGLKHLPKELRRDVQLSTSFSDLRYYLECSHDFYLRKVLGFSPTIDQAFGYGRGVHNLLRAVHADPKKWAELAKDRTKLRAELQKLIDRGLFYLRYTTGEPAERMRQKGIEVVGDYIAHYVGELRELQFEPEKSFETLVEYEDTEGGALVSGAIDIIRKDNPPQVTLIDFKSGDPDSDKHQKLDEQEMKLQVALYAVAAKKELEFLPDQGLVRYLGAKTDESRELSVPLAGVEVDAAKRLVAQTAAKIRDRSFSTGPTEQKDGVHRCSTCDFTGFCGLPPAMAYKRANPGKW